jgi:hypothetical protein
MLSILQFPPDTVSTGQREIHASTETNDIRKARRLPQVYWLSGSDVWVSIKNWIEKSW